MNESNTNPEPEPRAASYLDRLKTPPGLFLSGLTIYVLFTRLWRLGLKPVQHDESMFAYYSYHTWTNWDYSYGEREIMHGPLLQWALAVLFQGFEWFFKVLGMEAHGDSDYTMRLFPALCGMGIMGLVFLMREGLGRRGAYWALLFLAISPTFTFFSRFCRNDVPFLFACMLTVYAGWRYARGRGAVSLLSAPIFMALAISIKETYAIFFFILATFCLGCWIHGKVKKKSPYEVPFAGDLRYAIRRHWFIVGSGLLLGGLAIVLLFSSFFQHAEYWNGPYRAVLYWAEENRKRRIPGLFHFHLLHMSIYELPFLIFWVVCVVKQMWPAEPHPSRSRRRKYFIAWLLASYLVLVWVWDKPLPKSIDDLLHMNRGMHAWIFLQVCLVVGITGWKHLSQGRTLHAFVDYWAAGSFLAYSYAGEKVPWVGLHIMLPLLISCGLYADMSWRRWFGDAAIPVEKSSPEPAVRSRSGSRGRGRKRKGRSALAAKPATAKSERGAIPWPKVRRATAQFGLVAFAIIGLGWTLWLSNFLCFKNSGSPIERYTYASSHTDFHREMHSVMREAFEQHEGYDTQMAYQGTMDWPLLWTLRRYKQARWHPTVNSEIPALTDAKFIIIDQYVHEKSPPYMPRYDWTGPVRFRHYWQPIPLNWEAMKKFRLLLRNDRHLNAQQRLDKVACRNDWGKLLTSMIFRDEDRQGPYRWEHLGGINVFVGRLKPVGPQK